MGNDVAELPVQYVILNTSTTKNWGLGAIVAQACHASLSAIVRFRNFYETELYTAHKNLNSMRKVILQANGEEYDALKATLIERHIDFVTWEEIPEGLHTCMALRPYFKKEISSTISHLKLLK